MKLSSSSPEMITNSDKFPEGLRVLAVDDNIVCLRLLEALLLKCGYKVTVTKEAFDALKILRENKCNFDIVITDVHMLDMDGFRLLEIIGLEMDIPVIMISSNEDQLTVMKGIEHGACDYLLKPIRLDVIKNIWQHVIRKSKFDNNDLNIGKGLIKSIAPKGKKRPNSQINGKDLKDDERNVHSKENDSTHRKPRFTWTQDLHKKFLRACEKLGPDKAVPSKILEEMDVPNLTREKVASHLQKYRTAVKKTGDTQKNNRIGSNGMNEHLMDDAILSFHNQGSNGVNRLNGFRTNGPITSQMNQFGHHIQKPDAFNHSFANPMLHLNLPRQPNLSAQPFPNNLEVLDETCQRIHVHGPRDIYPNSVRMENLCNGVMQVSSRMSGYNASNELMPSLLPGGTSNSFLVNNLFDLGDYSILDDINLSNTSLPNQNYSEIRTAQEMIPGPQEGVGLVRMDMQSSNVEYPLELEELPDGFYHLSSCSSTDDDLSAVVKQSMTVLK